MIRKQILNIKKSLVVMVPIELHLSGNERLLADNLTFIIMQFFLESVQ